MRRRMQSWVLGMAFSDHAACFSGCVESRAQEGNNDRHGVFGSPTVLAAVAAESLGLHTETRINNYHWPNKL